MRAFRVFESTVFTSVNIADVYRQPVDWQARPIIRLRGMCQAPFEARWDMNRTAADLRQCASCKRRKIKCDGNKPVCSGCEKYGETCDYGEAVRPPSVSAPQSCIPYTMPGAGVAESRVNRSVRRNVATFPSELASRAIRAPPLQPSPAPDIGEGAGDSLIRQRSSLVAPPSPVRDERTRPVTTNCGFAHTADNAGEFPIRSPDGATSCAVGDLQHHVTRAVTGEVCLESYPLLYWLTCAPQIMHHGATSMLYADPLDGIVMNEIALSPHDGK